ncbi:MAG: hypothetical protein RJA59_1124 [Pseudomonadota bacterium]
MRGVPVRIAAACLAALVASGCGSSGASGPAVVSVEVTPASFDVTAGGSAVPLTARATLADATVEDVSARATWTTSAPGAVDVAAGEGAAAAGSARVGGTVTVRATYGGREGASTARIVRGPAIGVPLSNDPLALQQWFLRNTGQNAYADGGGTPGEDLRLAGAHALGLTGKGVKVGVIDSGLEIRHPDLAANVVPGSWDFLTGTDDPSPPDDSTRFDHGTSVSGIIGMAYGNGVGGMGVAPGVGLNAYNALVTGSLVAYVKALGASSSQPASSDVWIFNQSYGSLATSPTPIHPAVEAQYAAGVATLRSGRGAVYVRAAGNQFESFGTASCADARALGISCGNPNLDAERAIFYNVVVGSLSASGKRSSYSTAGSALWVSAPGGEYGNNASVAGPSLPPEFYLPAMVTTDRSGCRNGLARSDATDSAFNQGTPPNGSCDYTNTFNGTSSACPSTVGAVALLLDARPDLTWRDVKHVLAVTARRVDPDVAAVTATLSDGAYTAELPWTRNAAGRWFHNWYGFGAVDVDAAVTFARSWEAGSFGALVDGGWLPGAAPPGLAIPDHAAAGATSTITVPGSLVVEALQIEVTITHPRPGDLGIELTSPSGTRSILLNIRNGLAAAPGLKMTLVSNAFYGEPSAGVWTLKVVDGRAGNSGTLDEWKLRVLGH